MDDLGGMGRVFGAMLGKLGVPLPTVIAQSTLEMAREICQQDGPTKEADPRIVLLRYGYDYKGSVERQQAIFFLLRVPPEVADGGLILRCRSPNKSRFKLILFDQRGGVRYQEESTKAAGGNATAAALQFTPFEVSVLGDVNPLNLRHAEGEDPVPQMFLRLDTFQIIKRKIEPGDHLVGVYGDNFLNKANFVVTAVPIAPDAAPKMQEAQSVDAQLAARREELREFKGEWLEAAKRWIAMEERRQQMELGTEEMITKRESAYNAVLSLSQARCLPAAASGNRGATEYSVTQLQATKARARNGSADAGAGTISGGGSNSPGMLGSFGRMFGGGKIL
ncbi:unnamed protein product [Phaeothamnion confervicola]